MAEKDLVKVTIERIRYDRALALTEFLKENGYNWWTRRHADDSDSEYVCVGIDGRYPRRDQEMLTLSALFVKVSEEDAVYIKLKFLG